MTKRLSACSVLVAVLIAPAHSVHAQSNPISGVYQIVSGQYIECCGIAGALRYPLPAASQRFVRLTVDSGGTRAQMAFLADDMTTVLQIPESGPRAGFTYDLSNGTVTPGRIQFGEPNQPPIPGYVWFSFTVSNSADALRINGTVVTPCPGCFDFYTEFTHSNVVAYLMPTAAIRVSEVSVCWNAVSNRSYQVQYASDLATNVWNNLGSPITATGAVQCVADKVPPEQPGRYYRVLPLP